MLFIWKESKTREDMKIAISGANGYIAGNLIEKLKKAEHEIIPINRDTLYDPTRLIETIAGTDAVIHLAGAPILCRWTAKNKAEIIRSRTISTQNIVQAINQLDADEKPHTLILASAVGIYSTNDVCHTENSTDFADSFVGEVVKSWEKSSNDLTQTVRKVTFRIGVVLGKNSKTIQNMLPVFRIGLGGKIGSGKQAFPFIHIIDLVNAIQWALANAEVHGLYNLTAPQNITNLQLTREIANQLNRPALIKVPEFVLKIVYGEAASLLLEAPIVYPERLIRYGFRFKYPDIKSCLNEIS